MLRLRRMLRRRRARLALLATTLLAVVAAVAWAGRPHRVVDAPPVPLAEAAADARAQQEAGETTPTGRAASRSPSRRGLPATAVPDVPLAWRREAEQAASWPAASDPPVIGQSIELPTVPSSRVRDTIGLNVDLWRTEYGWADFSKVLAKVRQLHLRHARVGMQSGATFGLSRMQQLGRAGVRLNVVMGDAYGRYGTAPYDTLASRLRGAVLPYVDAVEGTNEADLTRRADWVQVARTHQEQVVGTVAGDRARPIGVIAPSVGRLTSISGLGDVSKIADAANAHAYSSAAEPSGALDQWLAAAKVQLPGGPTIVTEAGFQTDLRQRKYHTPTSPEAAAAYVPRTILEAIRRGIPQVYLYEMLDRWNDPFGIDTAAHFGLMEHDLTPKPAWRSLVRLQRALLDDGRPDAKAEPVQATVEAGPTDLRVLALRRRDGRVALALWRAAPVWDAQLGQEIPVRPAAVRVRLAASTDGALVTDVVSGKRKRLGAGSTVGVSLTGAPMVVTGLQPQG